MPHPKPEFRPSQRPSPLDTLRTRFNAFRSTHPPRTRIPTELRRDAVAALKAGVSQAAVARACGISSTQVTYWCKAHTAAATAPSILTVVDDPPHTTAPARARDVEVQLSVAGWSVRICFAPPTPEPR